MPLGCKMKGTCSTMWDLSRRKISAEIAKEKLFTAMESSKRGLASHFHTGEPAVSCSNELDKG